MVLVECFSFLGYFFKRCFIVVFVVFENRVIKFVSISFVVFFVSDLNGILFFIDSILVSFLSILYFFFLLGVLSFSLWRKYEYMLEVMLLVEDDVVMMIIG